MRLVLPLLLLLFITAPLASCGGDAAPSAADSAVGDTDAPDAPDAPDATNAADARDVYIPPLEKISKILFKLGGVSNTFDVNGQADYVPGGDPGKQLKLSANKALRKLEINIVPVEDFAVGHWADSEFSEVGVLVCYNDGSGQQELQACPAGFTHESIAYDITVASNNGAGSYVEGTFTATLQDSAGGTLEITDGVFDLKHR